MKIVHAEWEKRNLGRDAWEITLDGKDIKDVDAVMESLHADKFRGAYVCVNLPVGNLKMVHALEDDGFRFLECQLSLIDHFTPRDLLEQREGFGDQVTFRDVEKNPEAWERVIAKITPNCFHTDRISLDPQFGLDIACIRYKNWIRDLLRDSKSRMWVMEFAGKEVAFGVDTSENGRKKGILAATFDSFEGLGYGALFCAGVNANRDVKERTAVSSNNLAALRSHQNCGKVVYGAMYCFRKLYQAK